MIAGKHLIDEIDGEGWFAQDRIGARLTGNRDFRRKRLAGLPGIGKAASHLHIVHLPSPKIDQLRISRSLVHRCRDKYRRESNSTDYTDDQHFHPGLVSFKGVGDEFTDNAAGPGRNYLSGGLHES